ILSRLPVKTLVQFRCVCKSWNSLISDNKFSRKHFNLSTTRDLHVISYDEPLNRFVLKSYPLQSVFTDLTTNFTQLGFPYNSPFEHNLHYIVGSCDGILCLADYHNSFVVLWNPSIRKFKELPPFEHPELPPAVKYGFGYDHVSHNYKVVVVYDYSTQDTTKIKVYTLTTNSSWRNIQTLPFPSEFGYDQPGIHRYSLGYPSKHLSNSDASAKILSRLPVKTLVQFRCVCKSWNSLISDNKFSRKHFNLSTTRDLHVISYDEPLNRFVLKSYPLQSVFTDLTTNFTQLGFPYNSPFEHNLHYIVGSCDGILCLADYHNSFVVLWNPSIRKFKELPPFEHPELPPAVKYGFGYDHVSHNYKVVVVYDYSTQDTTKIKVYTLTTNSSWRNIQTLPFPSEFGYDQPGIHVREILSRLPVKTLVQFRCVCKSWNSLISDNKFSRKHFNLSTTRDLHVISYDEPLNRFVLKSYPLQSVFTDLTTNFTQLGFPYNSPFEHNLHYIVGSCDGILCLADYHNSFVVLWNPSIRKFKELPPFEHPELPPAVKYGFGYDHVSHNYKVVVVYDYSTQDTTKIKVYTLTTNSSWRNIQTLPFPSEFGYDQPGIHVR
ncbi:hypothetical protein RYX36_015425, partial [Vicia faba]